MEENSCLVLDDGSVFHGKFFGKEPPRPDELDKSIVIEKAGGEVVFNTGMAGYHEILTDPSYTGQIVTMTYPHIGNYGDNDDWSEVGPEQDKEASGVKAAGLAIRSLYTGAVPEGRKTIHNFLKENKTPGIYDIDTRQLTIKIRDEGSPLGVIVRISGNRISEKEKLLAVEYLKSFPKMEGRNLITGVGTGKNEIINPKGKIHFVLLDCGIKANIIRDLVSLDSKITLVPGSTNSESVLKLKPDAILLSNGPGDPAVLGEQIKFVKEIIGKVPLFGICLGHQLISLGLGAKTYKMKFGHHGVNHPVRDEFTKKVFVTSQNHGFAVDEKTLPKDVDVWFRNANDGSNEGIVHKKLPVATAQFHPESAPGPNDSFWIFKSFIERIK